MEPVSFGEIADLRAYCAQVVRRVLPTLPPQDVDDYISEAMLLATEHAQGCDPDTPVSRGLGWLLEKRLIDYRRRQNPDYDREAGTSLVGAPTGLSDEYAGAVSDQGRIESRLALSFIRGEADLRDPRTIGRLFSVPSWGALATGRAADVWPEINDERKFRL